MRTTPNQENLAWTVAGETYICISIYIKYETDPDYMHLILFFIIFNCKVFFNLINT